MTPLYLLVAILVPLILLGIWYYRFRLSSRKMPSRDGLSSTKKPILIQKTVFPDAPKPEPIVPTDEVNQAEYDHWLEEAKHYDQTGDTAKALECYEQVTQLLPTNAIAWNNKGQLYMELENYRKALECFRIAIKLDPTYVDAWFNKGLGYEALENYRKALDAYNHAAELSPEDAMTWYGIGKMNELMGDSAEAIPYYEQVIELDDHFEGVWTDLGKCHYLLNDVASAKHCWLKGVGLGEQESQKLLDQLLKLRR